MKKSEGERLKCAVYESTLSTADAVPLPQWGRQKGGGFAASKESQPRLAALGSPFQGKGLAWTLPPSYGRGGMKKSEEMHLKSTIYESTLSTAGAVPLPQGGRLRGATLYVDF